MARVIALTGGSGFIGGQIARMLVAQGCTVRALSRAQSGCKHGVEWGPGVLESPRALV